KLYLSSTWPISRRWSSWARSGAGPWPGACSRSWPGRSSSSCRRGPCIAPDSAAIAPSGADRDAEVRLEIRPTDGLAGPLHAQPRDGVPGQLPGQGLGRAPLAGDPARLLLDGLRPDEGDRRVVRGGVHVLRRLLLRAQWDDRDALPGELQRVRRV